MHRLGVDKDGLIRRLNLLSNTAIDVVDGQSHLEDSNGRTLRVELSIHGRDFKIEVYRSDGLALIVVPGATWLLSANAVIAEADVNTDSSLDAWKSEPPIRVSPLSAGFERLSTGNPLIDAFLDSLSGGGLTLQNAYLRSLRWDDAQYSAVVLPSLVMDSCAGSAHFSDLLLDANGLRFDLSLEGRCQRIAWRLTAQDRLQLRRGLVSLAITVSIHSANATAYGQFKDCRLSAEEANAKIRGVDITTLDRLSAHISSAAIRLDYLNGARISWDAVIEIDILDGKIAGPQLIELNASESITVQSAQLPCLNAKLCFHETGSMPSSDVRGVLTAADVQFTVDLDLGGISLEAADGQLSKLGVDVSHRGISAEVLGKCGADVVSVELGDGVSYEVVPAANVSIEMTFRVDISVFNTSGASILHIHRAECTLPHGDFEANEIKLTGISGGNLLVSDTIVGLDESDTHVSLLGVKAAKVVADFNESGKYVLRDCSVGLSLRQFSAGGVRQTIIPSIYLNSDNGGFTAGDFGVQSAKMSVKASGLAISKGLAESGSLTASILPRSGDTFKVTTPGDLVLGEANVSLLGISNPAVASGTFRLEQGSTGLLQVVTLTGFGAEIEKLRTVIDEQQGSPQSFIGKNGAAIDVELKRLTYRRNGNLPPTIGFAACAATATDVTPVPFSFGSGDDDFNLRVNVNELRANLWSTEDPVDYRGAFQLKADDGLLTVMVDDDAREITLSDIVLRLKSDIYRPCNTTDIVAGAHHYVDFGIVLAAFETLWEKDDVKTAWLPFSEGAILAFLRSYASNGFVDLIVKIIRTAKQLTFFASLDLYIRFRSKYSLKFTGADSNKLSFEARWKLHHIDVKLEAYRAGINGEVLLRRWEKSFAASVSLTLDIDVYFRFDPATQSLALTGRVSNVGGIVSRAVADMVDAYARAHPQIIINLPSALDVTRLSVNAPDSAGPDQQIIFSLAISGEKINWR